MARVVYLVITDLHFGNFTTLSRVNYRDEVFHVKTELLKIAIKYRTEGAKVVTILLGDIFHSGYRDVTQALVDENFITMWKLKIGDIYAVMGNHEFTYYRANPFYAMVSSIESERVQTMTNKVWQPIGMSNILRVVDSVQDGDVTFYFNHYGTGVQQPCDSGVSIGLFHQDLVDHQIVSEISKNSNRKYYGEHLDVEGSGILEKYDYCFFGHVHTVYGVWKSGNTYLHYLASLGRTNESEVQNDFLERNIPAVVIEDGKFSGIEDNFIMLIPRDNAIQEDNVSKNREQYQKTKEIRQLRNYVPIDDDPIKNILSLFQEEPEVVGIVEELLVKDVDTRFTEIKRKMRELGIGNQ